MRIISKFRDYYDVGTTYGIDPHIVYLRTTSQKAAPKVQYYPQLSIIGFCGQIIPCIDYPFLHACQWNIQGSKFVLFNSDIWEKELELSINKYTAKGGHINRSATHRMVSRKNKWESHRLRDQSEYLKTNPQQYVDLFEQHQVPIWILHPHYGKSDPIFEVNPCLLGMGFENIYPALDAFQMISQFIANMNAKSQMPDPRPTTETENLQRHGMDKHNFRRNNHPHKPRGNK